MVLGLPHGHNYLVPHHPEWPRLFEEERERLRLVLDLRGLDIQHVGSTAVSGLMAKPIIDIAIAAASHRVADDWQERMASIGYDYPGDIGIPDHRIFGRDPDARRFLVHVVDAAGFRWRDFLRFRDRLRSDRRLAAEYEAAKRQAASAHPTGLRSNYNEAKADFIERVLKQ